MAHAANRCLLKSAIQYFDHRAHYHLRVQPRLVAVLDAPL
eukprot:SAG31_NODE_15488_length_752_cov_1.496172_1_plen_39_part_10